MTAVLAALLAAACFALAGVLQHSGAAASSTSSGLGLRLLLQLMRDRSWLAGLLLATAGLALHALALARGQLLVVQPLLVTGLVFTLLAAALRERRPPTRAEIGWGSAVAAGLAGYLLAARPSAGLATATDRRLALAVAGTVVVVLACSVAGRLLPRRAPLLLGTAAGCCFGGTAALLKQLVGVLPHVGAAAVWPLLALAGLGVVGIALAQSAYQAGALAASAPALTVVEPVVAGLVGAVAFHELPALDPLSLLAQAVALAVIAAGVLRLSAPVLVSHPPRREEVLPP